MVKVSLIVPIYNTSKYLNRCIDSLINQSLKDIELILINDGSTDDSEKIVKSYKDKRIKYISKKNQGIGKTRNLGIDEATGEYLAFVDSDDYIHRDFCKKMYNKAVKDKCDIVICDYFEERNNLIGIKFDTFADTSLKENPKLINKINLGPCNKLYKKELFNNKKNRFVENLKYEDAPFVIKLLLDAKKIGKVDDYLTYYVIREKSQTTTRDEKMFDILKIVDIMIKCLEEVNYEHDAKVSLAVMVITDYTIQQRYIKDSKQRNKFIDEGFAYLNKLDRNWRNCTYLNRFDGIKRLVKISKVLTKLYCYLYILEKV